MNREGLIGPIIAAPPPPMQIGVSLREIHSSGLSDQSVSTGFIELDPELISGRRRSDCIPIKSSMFIMATLLTRALGL
jgi:hypothetical protein